MNLHACAEFGPDRTTGGDVYTPRRTHTQTDTHTLSYIDIDVEIYGPTLQRNHDYSSCVNITLSVVEMIVLKLTCCKSYNNKCGKTTHKNTLSQCIVNIYKKVMQHNMGRKFGNSEM